MSINDIRKRLHTLEAKNSYSKIFFNKEHEMDEEIARYKREHPYAGVFVIEVRRAKVRPDDND